MKHSISKTIRRFRAEWIALGSIQLIIGAFLVQALYSARNDVYAHEADRLQVQARVIEENLVRQLEGVNNALAGVRIDLPHADSDGVEAADSASLKLLSDAMPGVRTMAILDVGGTIVASSRAELIGKNFRQREYFDAPRRRPDPGVLYVSPPFESSLGVFVIIVGRVLTGAGGKFEGVVIATLDPDYFEVVLRSVLYAPDMRTTLIHGDGKLFLSVPSNAQLVGLDVGGPGSLFTRHLQSGQPATLGPGRLTAGGEDRIVAMHHVDRADLKMDKPLVAVASRDLSAIYLPWQSEALHYGAFYAALVLASGLGMYGSQRRRQAFASLSVAAANDRRQGAERLEFALQGAGLGLWDFHMPSNTLIVNAHERAMLGYAPGEDLWADRSWRKLIHPDDWPTVKAAVAPHFSGETAAYECEHRMRHKDGHWIWIFNRAMIVERTAAGAPVRIVGTHLNITERKLTEAALAHSAGLLRSSEAQLRQVTDNMPVLVSYLDLDQRFRFVNGAYRDWLDIEPSSLLGRSLRELYGEHEYSKFHHHIEAVLAGRRVVYERDLATPGGQRHVEVTLVPQRENDGSIHGFYGLISDITARHEAELQRARSEERLSLALEGSGLALFDWDIAGDRIYHSAQASAMCGDPATETTTSPADLQSMVHPDDLAPMLARMKAALNGSAPLYHAEFRTRTRSGDWLWVRARGRVVERDSSGRAVRLAGTYANIDERKNSEDRLRRLAEFDTLTDLPNRALFHDRLGQAMVRAARNKPMALLFLDIDHFKTINDTLGHGAGDELLKVLATRMRASVRESDTVARLSGDEFTIILEGLGGLADATALASNLVEALREPIDLAGKSVEVTVSVGVAMCLSGETDNAALLRRADAALYEAKRRGRNSFACADDTAPAPLRAMTRPPRISA